MPIRDMKDLIHTPPQLSSSHFSKPLPRQRYLAPICRAQRQRNALLPNTTIRIPALNLAELLQQTGSDVARLSKRILLTQANAWSTVERKVLPARSQGLPALRLELCCVRAVKILATVHGVRRVADDGALGNEKWGFAIGTSAKGEEGVFNGEAGV